MEVKLQIPDDIAQRFSAVGNDVSRVALEALALEGYREHTLTLFQVMGWSAAETLKCRVWGKEAFHETTCTRHRSG